MISIVIPIYNESKNISVLFSLLHESLINYSYEIIAVNDGSVDSSWEELKKTAIDNSCVKLINFKRNFGQTAAINAGIQFAKGDIIVLIDSDLENDPNDIKNLLNVLEKGYDVVSGWRKDRWEGKFLSRKLPSIIANKLISKISGVHLHDYGCTLKAYRKDIIKDVRLYGQMHRFIPVFCNWQGGKVTEIPVSYKPRIYGKSNYGLFRIYKVILDLILIKFLDKFMHRPIHFFGGAGILSFIVMFACAAFAVYFKITGQKDFIQTPLPTLSAMFFIVGILMILLGVIAEMIMRTYFESQNKFPFTIKEKINIDN
ncbi:MAG: glycosyl transferase [Bacteroidetes bacterium RIFOXYA12_FULL_35_11]|nr:MAG: glycosyl transferase [Bacteroidetes bacterium GWF2_35_48]OFY81648.1 MAG: glycosyl transferase [Bacteroidetes bacterium RIFOXYA12_FULL_35_11]OFY95459.1 MAG: glycosyl transferase [Bacteroidetes bacterium RIFOXYC12_FULL_35_7]HBX52981.1 glycosyltransferase [Bacteroidales bacterium]